MILLKDFFLEPELCFIYFWNDFGIFLVAEFTAVEVGGWRWPKGGFLLRAESWKQPAGEGCSVTTGSWLCKCGSLLGLQCIEFFIFKWYNCSLMLSALCSCWRKWLAVCVCVCVCVCVSVCLSVSLSVCLSLCLSFFT